MTNMNPKTTSYGYRVSACALMSAMIVALVPATVQAQSSTQPQATAPSEPTSLREAPLQYLMNRGDTLIEVARKYLRQPSDYRQVQRENAISNPRRIPTGRTINIEPELLRTRHDPARLESYRGDVRVLRATQSLSLSQGVALHEGDTIVTGSNAFARLTFSDGSHTVIPSNSRLKLERLRRFIINDAADHRLVIEQGRSESRVTSRQRPGGFRVITPTAVSAVRGTEFRVAYDAEREITATGVLEGRVAVASAEHTDDGYLFGSGTAALTREGEMGVTSLTLLTAPSLAEGSSLQTGATLSFDAIAPQGASKLRGWFGADAGLLDPVAEIEAAATAPLQLSELPEGQWFLRLSAVSPDGVEGRARTYNFVRAVNTIGDLEQNSETVGDHQTYRFAWRAGGEGEATFRFQLFATDAAGEAQGQPLIDSPGLSESRFTLTDLPPGDYSWRVEGLRYRFGHRLSVWSQPELLTISR